MPKYFHYISYLQYLFYLFGIYFIFTESIFKTENYLAGVGFGITLIGIGIAIGSLGNIENLSKKEKKIIDNPKKFKEHTRSLFVLSLLGLLASVFFLSIKFINTSVAPDIAADYTSLGYGSTALALGVFFELKQMYEKRLIYNQQNGIE